VVAAAVLVALAVACAPPPPPPTRLIGVPGPVAARVSVSQFRDLDPDVQQAAFAAAADVGAGAALLYGGTLGLRGWYRNGVPQALAPEGGQYPMSSAAVDPGSATELYGQVVGDSLAAGAVVMSRTSAGLFGAAAGDVVELRRWSDGGLTPFTIGAVLDDAQLPAELVLSQPSATSIGFTRASSVQIYGYPSDKAINNALAAHGLVRGDVRISRPGVGGPTPDATIGLAETKAKLGQFWYIPHPHGTVTIDPAWQQANLVRVAFTGVPVVATCHRLVIPAIQGAFDEIAAAGLAAAIDTVNTNRYGGCFAPREVRAAGGTTGGNLSRHTWAMAIAMNTATNPMGGVPTMDCRVVWIFRKWGFAWGGNFSTPDGMHFEWVGQDRSQISYASSYCPNPVAAPAGARASAESLLPGPPSLQEPYEGE
jgi:hypothetical protein